MRFGETELREERWDPLAWVYLLGDGLFPLLAREFAPLGERLASRRGAPGGDAGPARAARRPRSSGSTPGRPVGRFQTETALEPAAGRRRAHRRTRWPQRRRRRPADPAVAAVRPRLEPRPTTARAGRSPTSRRTCATSSCRASEGEGRLGADLFARKLRHTMRSEDAHAGADPRPRPSASSPPSGRRWSGSRGELWPTLAPRTSRRPTTTARSSAASSTRSPASTRRPTSCSTSAARS